MLSGKLSIALNRLPDVPLFAFGKFFRSPRSREVVDVTAFCSLVEEVFDGRPRAACDKTNNRDFAKKPKESNYHTLLNLGQLAAYGFTHWWWSNGQKKFVLILRGFRTDLFTKTFA